MNSILYDSYVGRFLRIASRGKLLPFREHVNASHVERFSADRFVGDDSVMEKGEKHTTSPTEIVGWYSPDDPENPRNWTTAVKSFVTLQICFLTFAVYIGSSIYSPGIPGVESEFQVSEVAATVGLTVFVLGYAVGPMILAPIGEMPGIGRNPVYLGTLLFFVLFQIPTALSTDLGMLIVFRFLGGVLGSPGLSIGGASLSEMYSPQDRGVTIGLWGLAAVCGPALGPLVGGYASETHNWRWTIWSLMAISGAAFVLLLCFLPETSSKNILARRAARLRRLTGNSELTTQAEIGFKHVTAG